MVKKLSCIVLLLLSIPVFAWGPTGHRVTGKIAEVYLTKKAKKKLDQVLKGKSLAEVSTWMDEIRSDDQYDYTHDWHWVTLPDGMTYEQAEKNPKGDAIASIERLMDELEKGGLSPLQEAEHVKILVHLIGDIHQPLHVGTGEDRGGNDVKVKWFRAESNLHRVWDSGMIDHKKYSYTELAEIIDKTTKQDIEKWQAATVRDWAEESKALREQVYDLPGDKNMGYKYVYHNWETVELRLLQAGVRLAGVLNKIYG